MSNKCTAVILTLELYYIFSQKCASNNFNNLQDYKFFRCSNYHTVVLLLLIFLCHRSNKNISGIKKLNLEGNVHFLNVVCCTFYFFSY